MIVFENVTKIFGNGAVALENVSFEINDGEFVVIQGPSGAGKSTVLRLIIKEIPEYEGKILIDGDDISKIGSRNTPLLRRKIGAAFQDFKILPERTVKENIELALDILDLEDDIIEKRILELVDLTGIKDKLDLFPSQLSGGELQRVALARALAPQPKIIFADEPTGNLDEKTAWQIIELLKDINSQGTSVILATHDKNIINKLSVRVIEIESGKLIKDSGSKKQKTLPAKDKEDVNQEKNDKPSAENKTDDKKSKQDEAPAKEEKNEKN